MAPPPMKSDGDCPSRAVRCKHRASPRARRDRNHRIHLRLDLQEGEGGHHLLALEGEIGLIGEMLQRTSAALAIVRAPLTHAIRARAHHIDKPRAVTVNLNGYRLARQRQWHEHFPPLMVCHAIALRPKALDLKCDGARRHRRDQAGSAPKGQPSLAAGNRNVAATRTALKRPAPLDMVPRMLTVDELQILATSLGVAGRAVLFSLPVAIAFAWALVASEVSGQVDR